MVLTVVSNLFEELNASSGYERVAAKFVENEFEKCDRLFEVYYMSVQTDHFSHCNQNMPSQVSRPGVGGRDRTHGRSSGRTRGAHGDQTRSRTRDVSTRMIALFDVDLTARSPECVDRSV